ncbi:MAG TPA: diaminopimelate decarboxylase [Bacteroidota bacterium]|nr:diaminopimelate decarboxylase [Bacteroidota bacterium]
MSHHFRYRNKEMYCEGVRLADIVNKVGSPVYVYSKKTLLDAYHEFDTAFASVDHLVCFAMKANSNLAVVSLFAKAGAGIDCNSGGEIYRALKAGAHPSKIIFTGVGKTEEEIRFALQYDILMFKAESRSELRAIDRIAGEMGKKAPVGIRINPNVDPKTHPYIATGLAEDKFGIDQSMAFESFALAASLPNLRVVGLDMHIGSQIVEVEPFVEAATKMAVLALELKKAGFNIEHFDMGGGLGIPYKVEKPASPKDLAEAISAILNVTDCRIIFEPGRYLVGNAGVLVTKVLYTKKHKNKNFLIVDAAMNDLIRPSLYDAYHKIRAVELKKEETMVADIVGPVCESGDFFAHNRTINKCRQNDLLAIMSTGAYGFTMSSNYNARLRAPEVMVDGTKFYTVRERETYEDLTRGEKMPEELLK